LVLGALTSDFAESFALLRPDGTQRPLTRVDPAPGSVWVSSDGQWIGAVRPTSHSDRTPLLAAWHLGSTTTQPAPFSFETMIGMTTDRSAFLLGTSVHPGTVWAVALSGGPASEIPLPAPVGALVLTDQGIPIYSGPGADMTTAR